MQFIYNGHKREGVGGSSYRCSPLLTLPTQSQTSAFPWDACLFSWDEELPGIILLPGFSLPAQILHFIFRYATSTGKEF